MAYQPITTSPAEGEDFVVFCTSPGCPHYEARPAAIPWFAAECPSRDGALRCPECGALVTRPEP